MSETAHKRDYRCPACGHTSSGAMRSHADVLRARRMLAEALPAIDPATHPDDEITRTETAIDILEWVLGDDTGFASVFRTMCATEDGVLGRALQQGPGGVQ
jgi:hypothetical protein